MDEQIGALMTQIEGLNAEVKNGEVYQSLGRRLGELMDGIHRRRRTEVELPDDEDGIDEILANLKGQLQANDPVNLPFRKMRQLIQHLESPDPLIRYQGVNFTIYNALQQNALSSEQLLFIFNQLTQPEDLFAHSLEPANAAVFGRSGRINLLAVLLHFVGENQQVASKIDWHQLVILATTAVCLETDTRGFINHQGWAHTFAALTDLLVVLAASDRLDRADKLFLMVSMIERLRRLTTPLIYGENDRMAAYFIDLANRHTLYEQTLVMVLQQWRKAVALHRRPDTIAGWNRFFNRKRLLDSFRLHKDLPKSLEDYLNSTIDFLG